MNVHTDVTTIHGTVVATAPAPTPKSPGKIKLADGTILSAFAEKLALVREGASYAFGITFSQGNRGQTFRNIASISPLGPIKDNPNFVSTAEVRGQGRPTAQAQQPGNEHANWKQNEPTRLQPPASRGAAFPPEWQRPTYPTDARRMFLTATLGHYIDTGRVDLNRQSIRAAIVEILGAYDDEIAVDDPQ